MTFAELFRKSTFAQVNPRLKQIFTCTRPAHTTTEENTLIDQEGRPRFFGLKKDLPDRFYGRLHGRHFYLQKIDGPFGQAVVEDAELKVLEQRALHLLLQVMGRVGEGLGKQQRLLEALLRGGKKKEKPSLVHRVDFYGGVCGEGAGEPILPPAVRVQVLGTVLQKEKDGYLVEVAGMPAFVENGDLAGFFCNLEIGKEETFWLKSLQVEMGNLKIFLSMKKV